ncbi:cadherin domain protein [Ancylostoma caninum]|uniref:Cadherin domain protein n=1 Tax=Ancylostoma caninum TaxID=29170 RepID=A0A368G749_ANCCA|nr:cadherin domain protein [Ancylostoma caninum]
MTRDRQDCGLKIIHIDEKSGEITLAAQLDYEKHKKFEILAVPLDGGEGIPATIEVEDVNDHSPTFPEDKIKLEISEFARIGAAYPLPRADDPDGANFTVQKYRIAQGNVNNVFKISVRPVNGVLYADLVVNGQLDREYRDKYELVVEAIDGGTPAKIGRLRVNIFILDANDNAPMFTKPRYSIAVPSNLSVGSQILTLKATDGDVGDNGKVAYRFQKTRVDTLPLFSLSSNGVLSTAAHLLPGTVHDLVVVAYDGGVPSLETTAIVTVTVQGTSLTAPAVDIIWLTDTATAHLLENVTLGTIVARLSLNEEQKDSVVTLTGCPSLCLRQSQSPSVYLLLACGLFDRESSPEYHLKFSLRRGSELVLEHPVLLTIGDINDNAPKWPHSHMHITLNRSIAISDQTTSLTATDPDQGTNGRIRYSILDSDVITIDPDTGRLTPLRELDCSLGQEIRFKVRATDGGTPSLSSDLQVTADLVDGYGRPPQFEKSLYKVEISEDSEIGTCLLKVTFFFPTNQSQDDFSCLHTV